MFYKQTFNNHKRKILPFLKLCFQIHVHYKAIFNYSRNYSHFIFICKLPLKIVKRPEDIDHLNPKCSQLTRELEQNSITVMVNFLLYQQLFRRHPHTLTSLSKTLPTWEINKRSLLLCSMSTSFFISSDYNFPSLLKLHKTQLAYVQSFIYEISFNQVSMPVHFLLIFLNFHPLKLLLKKKKRASPSIT